eukprot:2904191-Amphidinium_carterae.1
MAANSRSQVPEIVCQSCSGWNSVSSSTRVMTSCLSMCAIRILRQGSSLQDVLKGCRSAWTYASQLCYRIGGLRVARELVQTAT